MVSGEGVPVSNPRKEPVDFYKVSKLKLLQRAPENEVKGPPWEGVPPSLEEYRQRGHRRLATRTCESKCKTCIWGCCMAVEIIVDHWKPSAPKYRSEIFCYGPKSCPFYKAGPRRKVPGRKGMVYEEPDWVDEDETAHRDGNTLGIIKFEKKITIRELLIDPELNRQYSYKKFVEIVNSVSNLLWKQGIGNGDKVSILMQNSPRFLFAFFGIMQLGAVACPINIHLKAEEIAFIFKDSESTALFVSEDYLDVTIRVLEGQEKTCKL